MGSVSSGRGVQVQGTKRMLLWPADAIADLYMYPPQHPLYRRSRVPIQLPRSSSSSAASASSSSAAAATTTTSSSTTTTSSASSRSEALAELSRRFPRFVDRAASSALEAVVRPGDAVFFPAYWFHYTETLSLSFSLGYRYLARAD